MLALPAPLREAIEARGSGLQILVLRLGAMGDIVRTLPAVRLVRSGLPLARMHWVAWDPWAELLREHRDVDTTIALPRAKLRAFARSPLGWPSLGVALAGVTSQLRALDAGLVLDFHGDFRTGLLGWVSGAPVRIGYDGHQQKEGNRLFTTHRIPAGDRRSPRLLRNLDMVAALGLPVRPVPDAGITIGPAAAGAAHAIVRSLAGGTDYAVLNPGASRRQSFKKPPARLFGAAAAALAEHRVASIVVCGPGEEADADRVVTAANGRALRAPATTLTSLAALLHGARVFVGGDSGPLHLACGVGCPVIGLYGPTDPVVNSPWNVPFVALARPGSAHTGIKRNDRAAEGFDGLTPDAVALAIHDILGRARDALSAP